RSGGSGWQRWLYGERRRRGLSARSFHWKKLMGERRGIPTPAGCEQPIDSRLGGEHIHQNPPDQWPRYLKKRERPLTLQRFFSIVGRDWSSQQQFIFDGREPATNQR